MVQTKPRPAALRQRVQRLVVDLCAGYAAEANGHAHWCWERDAACVYWRPGADDSLPGCRYFAEAVVPTDPALEADYWAARRAAAAGAPAPPAPRRERACASCGRSFAPMSNRQTRCPECAEAAARAAHAERSRRWRRRAASPPDQGSSVTL